MGETNGAEIPFRLMIFALNLRTFGQLLRKNMYLLRGCQLYVVCVCVCTPLRRNRRKNTYGAYACMSGGSTCVCVCAFDNCDETDR